MTRGREASAKEPNAQPCKTAARKRVLSALADHPCSSRNAVGELPSIKNGPRRELICVHHATRDIRIPRCEKYWFIILAILPDHQSAAIDTSSVTDSGLGKAL